MRILGIDPGLTGGVALLERTDTAILSTALTWPTPTIRVDEKNNLNIPAMVSLVAQANPHICYIERVGAMPKQGISSAFNFGVGFGIWLGILGALQIPYAMVTPKTWKIAMGLRGQPKSASLLLASQLFPSVILPRAKDEGQAEALLIAAYGQRKIDV